MQDATKKAVDQYRSQILALLAAATDGEGNPRLTPGEAEALANELSDEELADGIDFNTPGEVAEMLLEAGL